MTKNWWKEKVVYQIYPRSFQDSNGDGMGDIPGIISRLDELKDLGVGLLWLSPVYRSPGADNGYDISDYEDIDSQFGTLDDMKRLIAEAKKRGIGIVMDLVVNHTSDEHRWFQLSRDKNSEYRDYYIWRKGKENGAPPNNWTGFFLENCWEYDEKSGEYYLHLFNKKQPDLNYKNPKVIEEIKNILRFWLDLGVAGFRCDVINVLYKTSLADGKPRPALVGLEHYLTQEGNHEVLRKLRRDVLDEYDCFTVGETVFVTTRTACDLCAEERKELNMVFSFEHMDADHWFVKWFPRRFAPSRLTKTIAKWQGALEWNANYLENHDQPRSVSRFGDTGEYRVESAKLLATMLLTLRGTPFIYQGEELGMTNFDFTSMEQLQDVESHNLYAKMKSLHFPKSYIWKQILCGSRDHARTPMQWSAADGAGFTAGAPWLGINANHTLINYEAQKNDPDSVLSYYKKLIKLRAGSETLIYGDFKLLRADDRVFAYERRLGGETYTVLLNFTKNSADCPGAGELVTSNYKRSEYAGTLRPFEAVILKREARGDNT